MTSLFYSFHHASFQPEFAKLFFVGIMYASVYRITNNILIIFPFFWGIGAIWDVLVKTDAYGDGSIQTMIEEIDAQVHVASHPEEKYKIFALIEDS